MAAAAAGSMSFGSCCAKNLNPGKHQSENVVMNCNWAVAPSCHLSFSYSSSCCCCSRINYVEIRVKGDGVENGAQEALFCGRRGGASVITHALAEEGVGASSVGQEGGNTALLKALQDAIALKDTDAVKKALDQLKQAGWAKQWSSLPNPSCRTTYIHELTTLGIKNAENLAVPSVRNDAAFLATVVGTTSVLAVFAGQLPGDWGFFVPYLVGSISLAVLAIGSIAPGLLQVGINSFSSVFRDYQERLLRHEAAHFLVAYLLGLPVLGYSLDIGKEHVNLLNESLQKKIYEGFLDKKELDRLAVVSMAGLAAEGLNFDKVVGQSADLFSLQRLINRSKPQISNEQQQNLTRWAVLYAASLLKNNQKVYDSLMSAMSQKSPVFECIKAIEKSAEL
ncbi:hypothetical protein O6H91_03G013200 [Diphasiastrum complanatum]|uniref:Uncharacterized protein n=1 Tax=Diphasiastrum complanatum TaxID=34168 RepID=A0ACC2E3P1_DIPCM|nr:hypothetical protein O6H91_03G013200 [Diphasiastrum complanatum]